MRKTLFAAAACATVLWTGCSKSESVTVTIANPLAIERTGEMVEIPVNDIYTQLNLSDTAQFVIYDEKAQEVPYQLTYDEKVIFPVSIASKASVNYTVQQGTPSLVNAVKDKVGKLLEYHPMTSLLPSIWNPSKKHHPQVSRK